MHYTLKLYITGQTPNSIRALENLKKIAEDNLHDKYEIIVIDILKEPELAERDKILATPTLVKYLPPPIRKIVGDLSNRERVLFGLDLIS